MTMACKSLKTGVKPIASRKRHDSFVQCGEPASGKKLARNCQESEIFFFSRLEESHATHKTMMGLPRAIVA